MIFSTGSDTVNSSSTSRAKSWFNQRTRREGERTPAEAEIDHVGRLAGRDRLAAVLDDLQGRAMVKMLVGRCTESGRAHNGIGPGISPAQQFYAFAN